MVVKLDQINGRLELQVALVVVDQELISQEIILLLAYHIGTGLQQVMVKRILVVVAVAEVGVVQHLVMVALVMSS